MKDINNIFKIMIQFAFNLFYFLFYLILCINERNIFVNSA